MLRIGLIGCGYWARNYIRVLCLMEGVELAWLYSQTLRAPGCELPAATIFTNDYQAILKDPETQAIVVCTPPETHFPIAREAFQAGKDVLVEKPTATSSNDVLELIELAEKKQCVFMVGHIFL